MIETKIIIVCPFTGQECVEGCPNRNSLLDAVMERVGYDTEKANNLGNNAIGKIDKEVPIRAYIFPKAGP